jgi:hypothetical protein
MLTLVSLSDHNERLDRCDLISSCVPTQSLIAGNLIMLQGGLILFTLNEWFPNRSCRRPCLFASKGYPLAFYKENVSSILPFYHTDTL